MLTVASVRQKDAFCMLEMILGCSVGIKKKWRRANDLLRRSFVPGRGPFCISVSASCGYFVERLVHVLLCSLKKEALDALKSNQMWSRTGAFILICFPVKLWRLGCHVEAAN